MNVGLYQSASALSALERWQDLVSQNITSSQTTGYRKRTISFSTQSAGELQADPHARIGGEGSVPVLFPKVNSGISFVPGETQPTRRELDTAIQGEGFFEIQRPDGSKAYTRSGEFRMRADRMLVTSSGDEVLSEAGAPITLVANGGSVVINPNGSIFQGATALGKIAVKKFASNSQLIPIAGGFFVPGAGAAAPSPWTIPSCCRAISSPATARRCARWWTSSSSPAPTRPTKRSSARLISRCRRRSTPWAEPRRRTPP
jgi:flagellar basal body rod protein FlgG